MSHTRSEPPISFQDQNEPPTPSSTLMEISTAMVALYKAQFGRGPTRARTEWAGPDTIVVLLEDTLTPAERNLVSLGEHQRLRDVRLFFQYASEEEFRAPVERAAGRRVRAFVSGIDTGEDVAVELFVLEPESPDAASVTE